MARMASMACLITALLALGGCSRKAPASPGANGDAVKGTEKATEKAEATPRIAAHVAAQLDVDASTVVVEPLADAEVPGLTVFTARVPSPKKGRPGRHVYGVASDTEVITDRARATTRVLDAWDYGPERSVPPEKVARVFGVLQGGSRDPTEALLTPQHIAAMGAHLEDGLFVPREAEVEGRPAVEYWITGGEVPVRKTTAVIGPDRSVRFSIEEKWD